MKIIIIKTIIMTRFQQSGSGKEEKKEREARAHGNITGRKAEEEEE